MKLFATIFPTKRLEFKIQISPKVNRSRMGASATDDVPLIKKHHSKKGMDSLIFNPSVALAISPAFNFDQNEQFSMDRSVLVPSGLIYQVASTISTVYNKLGKEKLFYTESNGNRIMDKNKAAEVSRKISIFTTSLIVSPTVINDAYVVNEIGILLSTPTQPIGALTHMEALAFVETFEHFDITTYTLLATLIEQNSMMDVKLDRILDMLYQLINANKPKEPTSMMKWSSAGGY